MQARRSYVAWTSGTQAGLFFLEPLRPSVVRSVACPEDKISGSSELLSKFEIQKESYTARVRACRYELYDLSHALRGDLDERPVVADG